MPTPDPFDFSPFEVLTFDCYGTLIDWEQGILSALRPVVGSAGTDDELLEAYATAEARLEAGPWRKYRDVVSSAMTEVAASQGVTATDDQRQAFGASVAKWPAFPDSAAALVALRSRYRLGVITNCDDDLFAASSLSLGDPFRWAVTAEQVRSYKPNRRNFEVALELIGVDHGRVMHVAQSLYHDHVPAKRLGLATAWIDRRHGRPGSGATPAAVAQPDITAPDMATFAAMALA